MEGMTVRPWDSNLEITLNVNSLNCHEIVAYYYQLVPLIVLFYNRGDFGSLAAQGASGDSV